MIKLLISCYYGFSINGNLSFNTYLISDATVTFDLKGQNDNYYSPEFAG